MFPIMPQGPAASGKQLLQRYSMTDDDELQEAPTVTEVRDGVRLMWAVVVHMPGLQIVTVQVTDMKVWMIQDQGEVVYVLTPLLLHYCNFFPPSYKANIIKLH